MRSLGVRGWRGGLWGEGVGRVLRRKDRASFFSLRRRRGAGGTMLRWAVLVKFHRLLGVLDTIVRGRLFSMSNRWRHSNYFCIST